MSCMCVLRASGTRSVGNNSPKWPFPNVNDFAAPRSASDRVGAPFFFFFPSVRCRAVPLLSPHTLSRPLSHSLTLSHTLSLALPLALPLPLLFVTLRKKSVLVYNTRSRLSVSRSISATCELRSVCSISKSRLMHCVECERRLLLVRYTRFAP